MKQQGNSLLIASVFVIHDQLLGNMSIGNPLEVLELFCNEFGYQIEISGQRSNFIHDAVIKIPNFTPTTNDFDELQRIIMNNIRLTDNGSEQIGETLGDFLAKPEMLEGTLQVNIALGYFINVVKYRDYLQANNLLFTQK